MNHPLHPGLHVRHDCLEPVKLFVTKGAKVLGHSRPARNNLVNEWHMPQMVVRLSEAFGGSPAVWLKMQMDYDLAQVEHSASKIHVKRVVLAA
jgi:addiction module HigA family antidote